MEDLFTIANKNYKSRLIVGTGKYKNFEETANAVKASGADIVTVAVRRINILDKKQPLLTDYLDPKSITYLPNTAGCYSSDEALRTLRLAREMGGWRLVKLEVLGDKKTLYPNMIETIKSTEILVKEGFEVMAYCTDDPILSKKIEEVGAYLENSISSFVFSTELLLAASSSKTSILLELVILSQFSHKFSLHKFSIPFMQLSALATILAVVVLPTPRIPVNK